MKLNEAGPRVCLSVKVNLGLQGRLLSFTLERQTVKRVFYPRILGVQCRAAVAVLLRMYSFMGGGLFCAIVGNVLLVVSTATDYWMQYRHSGSFAHQGLWRYCVSGKCYMQTDSIAYWNATRAFMILSAMSCFAGIIAGVLSFAHFSVFERFNRSFAAGIMFFISTLFVLLAMAIYTGVTVNFLGKRFGDWRFSWSYILGWVALLMTFFAGIFYMCAYRMHECRRMAGPR
ncbi:hypothetical protein GJAV_G00101280 [Gymnothorax javanicus]|nr:hypothetical protein GJAV_G00101280 [Gymnothorax javanicus]